MVARDRPASGGWGCLVAGRTAGWRRPSGPASAVEKSRGFWDGRGLPRGWGQHAMDTLAWMPEPAVIALQGELDVHRAHALAPQLSEAAGARNEDLIIDLSDVTLLDSSALGAILQAQHDLKRQRTDRLPGRAERECRGGHARPVRPAIALLGLRVARSSARVSGSLPAARAEDVATASRVVASSGGLPPPNRRPRTPHLGRWAPRAQRRPRTVACARAVSAARAAGSVTNARSARRRHAVTAGRSDERRRRRRDRRRRRRGTSAERSESRSTPACGRAAGRARRPGR
jgi:ABC-type transporter Mla MlaB component